MMKISELLKPNEFAETTGIIAFIFNHDECTFTELVREFKTERKHLISKIKQLKKLGLTKIEKCKEKEELKIYATKELGFFIKDLFERFTSEEFYDQPTVLSHNDKGKKIKRDKYGNMIFSTTSKLEELFKRVNFYIRSTAETLKKKNLL